MSKPTRLLIVDDEMAIRRFLKASVDPVAYEVIEAADGQTGMRLAATESPDLILLDLGLPDIQGVEVVRLIREWSEVPIIILSARGDEMNKVEALDAGANDYLTKPFGLSELFARVRAALRVNRSDRQDATIAAGDLVIDPYIGFQIGTDQFGTVYAYSRDMNASVRGSLHVGSRCSFGVAFAVGGPVALDVAI